MRRPAAATRDPLLRPARTAAAATALLAALAALAGPPARAGTYEVLACDAAPGAANNSWREHDQRGMLAATRCPSRGDPRRGLVVRSRVAAGVVRPGRAARMTFSAPRGAALAAIDLGWHGKRLSGGWRLGLVRGDGRLLAGCAPTRDRRSQHCSLTAPKGSSRLRRGLGAALRVRLEARCTARGGCSTAPVGGRHGPVRAWLAAQRTAVVVIDRSEPNLHVAGDMLTPAWRNGEARGGGAAADNVGIRAPALLIDGAVSDSQRPSCDHSRRIPCPRALRGGYRLDTRRLVDGEHRLAVQAVDTAGNVRSTEQTIRVDNTPPGSPRDVRLAGTSEVRSRNDFDIRWTPPGGQAAPLVRVHYRLCRVTGARRCSTGTRAGGARGIDGLSVPGRGTWRLRVWLEDAAGNVAAASASEPVTLRFDDRARTRLTAAVAAPGGGARARAVVGHGVRAELRGALRGRRGPLRGARLAVATKVRGTDRYRRAGTTVTRPDGRYRLRLSAGPSRTVRVLFAGNGRQRPAASRAAVGVRARSSIAVSRRRVRNGDRVRFRGRLLGGHVPRAGKLVQLEAHYRDRWRTFAVVRSDARGRWRRRYRFGGTHGLVVYPFRARIPRDARYPYLVGGSRVVRVAVDGR